MKKVQQLFKNSLFILFCLLISTLIITSSIKVYASEVTDEKQPQAKNPTTTSLSNQLFSSLDNFSALNLPPGKAETYIQSDILFYNSNGTNNTCSSSDGFSTSSYTGKVNMSGSNAYEKAWSAFRSIGYSKEQTAGIIGNILHESSQLNPVTHEMSQKIKYWKASGVEQIDGHFDLSRNQRKAYGLGIIQFSFDWRTLMYNYVVGKDPSLAKYFNEPETYAKGYSYTGDDFIRDAGEAVFDKIFALQVEFLHDPTYTGFYNRIKAIQKATTVEEMAGAWSAKVEMCSNCAPGGSEYNGRLKTARKIYNEYSHESFMTNGKSVTTNTNYTNNSTPTSGNHGTLLNNHSSITFYGGGASENNGYAGKNAGTINGGKLADGQVAISPKDPDLKIGDIIYIETTPDMTKEGAYAHGKYFIVADTGAGIRKENYNVDVFHDVAKSSDNNPAPYGSSMTAKIYKVASGVSWEDYLSKYKGKSGGQSDGTDVTIIGDTITNLSTSAIQKVLPKATINAQLNKHFSQSSVDNKSGIDILKELSDNNTLGKTIIFALGTYDRGTITSDDIKKVIDIAGKDRKIVFVTNYSKDPTENSDFRLKNNNLFNSATINNKNVTIADWSAVINNKTNLLLDNTTPNTEGSTLFAQTIQQAINNTVDSGGSTSNPNCDGNNNTTFNPVVVDGYTFPIQGATKANFLQPGNKGAGQSELSPLPCKNYKNGACHHDYAALDMGIRKKMVDGHEYTSKDFPGLGYPDWYYYSTGVKILAITNGKFKTYNTYGRATNGWKNKCASVQFLADDGTLFWIGHMVFENNRKPGDHFNVGDVIGEIAAPPCAIGTQSHVHFQVGTKSAPGAPTTIYDIFNKLWESVPEK